MSIAVAGPSAGGAAGTDSSGASPRSEIERGWFSGGSDLGGRVARTRQLALEFGAGDVDGAARSLLLTDGAKSDLSRAMLAVRLAPGLPLAHAVLSRALWEAGERRLAVEELALAVRAIPGHLESSLWLASSLLVLFAVVIAAASASFIASVAVRVFRNAAHDLGDVVSAAMPGFARGGLLASLLLLPILLGEGLLGLVLGLFALGFAYGGARHRVTLALAATLIVLALHPIARWAGVSLHALDADPVASAVLSVVRGVETAAELERLEGRAAGDRLAQYALALHARRRGDTGEAEERYARLAAARSDDPVALANLGNLRFARGDIEAATVLMERAAAGADSATLYFDLSQAHARSFRMEAFEAAMRDAQRVEPRLVAELSRLGAADFVADLPFPIDRLRSRMLARSDGTRFAADARRPVAPGRLGRSWVATAVAFAVAALLGLVAGLPEEPSSRCSHCGRLLCARCDGSVWSSDTCESCHRLFRRPETTDASLRTQRLMDLRRRELRLSRVATAASLLVPGVAGLCARRPDLGLLGLLFFGWAVASIACRSGVVPDPLAVGATGPLLLVASAAAALAAYAAVVGSCLMMRRRL